jgi:glycerol uptake facilitator-like aquaporin
MGISHWGNFWVLLGGQVVGSATAAAIYKYVNGGE